MFNGIEGTKIAAAKYHLIIRDIVNYNDILPRITE